MSKTVAIGIIIIFMIILTCGTVGLMHIKSEVDKEGITHFKIDWIPSILPLILLATVIWVFSVTWPVRFYRILLLDEIQQAKECVDERYDYCPHCGEKMEYSQKFPWSDEIIQNSVKRSNNENESEILKWLCDDDRGPLIDAE